MYGWRGRIGLLVPSINTTMETEFWRIAPAGVSVHTARIAGAMRQNSVSIVVLIEGTSNPILPRHPYMSFLLSSKKGERVNE